MSAIISTLNGTIWGSGYPDRLGDMTTVLEREQAYRAATLQVSDGIQTRTDAQLWAEFRHPVDLKKQGIVFTENNWRDLARQESSRLYDLGYTQIHSPPIAQRVFTAYRTAVDGATALDPAVYPSGMNNAEKLAEDSISKFEYRYVAAESVKELGKIVKDAGSSAAETLESARKVGENITNPIALSSLAILAVVGGALYFFGR